MTSFEATNSVINITDENKSFLISTPGHWNSKPAQKTIDELNDLLELRFKNDIELHTKRKKEKGLILIKDYSLSNLGTFENEILEVLKNLKCIVLEDMQLTYHETIDKLDLKNIPTERIGYSIRPGMYQIIAINFMLKKILPGKVKVDIAIEYVRIKSNLEINQTLIFTKKSFIYNFRIYSITFLSFR